MIEKTKAFRTSIPVDHNSRGRHHCAKWTGSRHLVFMMERRETVTPHQALLSK